MHRGIPSLRCWCLQPFDATLRSLGPDVIPNGAVFATSGLVSRYNDGILQDYCREGNKSVDPSSTRWDSPENVQRALASLEQMQLLLEMLGSRGGGNRKWAVIVPVEMLRCVPLLSRIR